MLELKIILLVLLYIKLSQLNAEGFYVILSSMSRSLLNINILMSNITLMLYRKKLNHVCLQ